MQCLQHLQYLHHRNRLGDETRNILKYFKLSQYVNNSIEANLVDRGQIHKNFAVQLSVQ